MLAQEIRRVVLWVKREGNQAEPCWHAAGKCSSRWASSENFLIHQWAKIGERTSRINKREYNHVAAQIGELDDLAVLAGHGEIGDRSPISSRRGCSRKMALFFGDIGDHARAAPAW